MPVFISHSFENKPEFDNVADALRGAGVPYWDPSDIKPGGSLRDQLREAVETCSCCVFVATHLAMDSSWCGSELGAFWGSGKPIVVYLADSSLAEDNLPPIVQPDVWERRLSRVAARAKELEEQHQAASAPDSKIGSAPVGNMTASELEQIVIGAISLARAQEKATGTPSSPAGMEGALRNAAGRMVEGLRTAKRGSDSHDYRKRILWVDDNPGNNLYERQALEAIGMEFELAATTDEALALLVERRFGAIISDMDRREGPREGYTLLAKVRETDRTTPYFIYSGSDRPEHKREALRRGAQGCTNRPDELLEMVVDALPD